MKWIIDCTRYVVKLERMGIPEKLIGKPYHWCYIPF